MTFKVMPCSLAFAALASLSFFTALRMALTEAVMDTSYYTQYSLFVL